MPVAFLLSLSSHVTVTILAFLVPFLVVLINFVASVLDIALYVSAEHEVAS